MLDEILSDLKSSIAKTHEALKRDSARCEPVAPMPAMLDTVRIDYYGVSTPNRARWPTVSVPEPRLITVKPWDKRRQNRREGTP